MWNMSPRHLVRLYMFHLDDHKKKVKQLGTNAKTIASEWSW